MSKPVKMNFNIEEEVDFDFEITKFNKYDLEDGTILRFFIMPTKVFRTDQYDKRGFPQYFIATQNIVSALVPKELRGTPNPNPTKLDELDYEDLEFKAIAEPWSKYELSDGGTLKIRTIATSIIKSDTRNGMGEPIYSIDHNMSYDVKVPRQFRKHK